MADNQELRDHIQQAIVMDGLMPEEKEQLIEGIMKNISAAITIAIFKKLNGNEQKEFLLLQNNNNEEKLKQYVSSKISNLEELVNQTIDETIKPYAGKP